MALETEYTFGEGITVPYAPTFDAIRKNRGFVDTRQRPDLAAKIIEGAESLALRNLLIDLASHDRYMSLGCDLGDHQESDAPVFRRCVAGGYVQLSSYSYELQETINYDNFCKALASKLKAASTGAYWRVEFRGTWVSFQLPGEDSVTKPSVWIWFFAAERTREKAKASREKLLDAILVSLNQRSVYTKLDQAADGSKE